MSLADKVLSPAKATLSAAEILHITEVGHPFLGWVTRDETWCGSRLLLSETEFSLTRIADYERVRFDGEELAAEGATLIVDRLSERLRAMGARLSKGLFVGGVAKSFAGNEIRGVDGLTDWLCKPSSEAWKGIDRSITPVKHAGHVVECQGVLVQEALLDATVQAMLHGSPRDVITWTHPQELERLLAEHPKGLEARSLQGVRCVHFQRQTLDGIAHVWTAADLDCPRGEAFRIPQGAFILASTGSAPHWLDLDGNAYFHLNTDAVEVRLGMYGNTGMVQPGICTRLVRLGE